MSLLDEINPLNPKSPLYLFPGPPLTPKQKKHGPTLAPGPNNLLMTPQQQKSGEQAVGQIAGGLLPAFLTTVDFWKGLGLILAGAAILIFAGLELKRI